MTHLPPVFIPEDIRQAMIDHAAAELPNECCGVLIGRGKFRRALFQQPHLLLY